MRKRGVTDFSLAMIDPWAAGYDGPRTTRRAGASVRPLTFVRVPGRASNGYARPVEGLIVLVDLDAMEVIDVARPRRRAAAADGRQLRRRS